MRKLKYLALYLVIILSLVLLNSCNKTEELSNQEKIYNMAVQSGYEGTYEQWLESIKGDSIELTIDESYICWKYKNETVWKKLISLTDLSGKDGKDGTNGKDGLSAYEIYLLYHPEYTKSEEEWIAEIVCGNNETKSYTVTFDTLGGSSVPSQSVKHGYKVNKPENPTKPGFTFEGWYVDDEKWSFSGHSVTSNMTLTAKYSEKSFVITYDLQGGEFFGYPNIITKAKYNDVISLPNVYKFGCTFDGWTINGKKVDNTFTYKYDYDITIVANWKVNTFSVKFLNKDGSSIFNPINVVYGEVINLPSNPTKDGVSFDGWYLDPGFYEKFIEGSTMPNEDLILYAKWVTTITFDSMGGSYCEPIKDVPLTYVILPEPTKDGYLFQGWYKEETFENEFVQVIPKSDITVYAKWSKLNPNTYYPITNFKDFDDNAYEITEADDGTTITATENKGEWSLTYDWIDCFGENYNYVEFKVQGTKDCKVIIKLEGGDSYAVEKMFYLTGEEQTVTMKISDANLSTITGQRFIIFLNAGNRGLTKEYNYNSNEHIYFDEAPYITIKSARICQAFDDNYVDATYAIHFKSNGGSIIKPIYITPNASLTLEKPTRNGYTFDGWYLDEELTNKFDGTSKNYPIILYAKWIKN